MPDLVKQFFWSCCYYSFLLMFLAGIWVLNGIAFILPLFTGPVRAGKAFRRILHGMVNVYVGLMEISGCLATNRKILRTLGERKGGLLIIANHPSMVDAPLFLSSLPGLLCVFKWSLKQGLLLQHTAATAGYLSNDEGMEMLRQLAGKLRKGEKVLIFPEGTRTNGTGLNPFNRGYALAALRAGAPVQLVRIRADNAILSKRQHFLKSARFPVGFFMEIGPTLEPGEFKMVKEMHAFVTNWYKGRLSVPGPAARRYLPARLESTESDSIITTKFRVPDHPFYCRGHMPGNPIVPAYVQMAWMHEILQDHFPSRIARLEYTRLKFLQPVLPGNVIGIQIQLKGMDGRVTITRAATVMARGRVGVEFEGHAA